MQFDYLASFPLSTEVLPLRLRGLLEPIGLSPSQRVEVACLQESDPHGPEAESVHLLTAVIPGAESEPVGVFDESGHGVVEFSVPAGESYGCSASFTPSISGHDYIVASWGNDSFFSFNLAEKVWMTLGLTPRCVGDYQQCLIYDDLGLPEFAVAEGEVSSNYHWTLKRDVRWWMSNEYLRRYLWLRGARGVRVFFYQARVAGHPELHQLMGGESHVTRKPTEGSPWYMLDLRSHRGGLLLQVWASVEALFPELCPEQNADGIVWPGWTQPITHADANALTECCPVYLDDQFLCKYEQSNFYDSTPVNVGGNWHCSPSYQGQWGFTDCRRAGRNVIEVPMRELYKPKPDSEILHARKFAIEPEDLANFDRDEEHIVAKVERLLGALLRLGDALADLGDTVGLSKSPCELTKFDRRELSANGWLFYPELCRLAQVAPLSMSQQEFLARCKSIHELWQRIPNGFLKSLLNYAGCPNDKLKNLGSLKLFQSLLNIVQELNREHESSESFVSDLEPENWNDKNRCMAPLFANNELRKADAHENFDECITTLQSLGLDLATLNTGYGRALDFVIDSVTGSISAIAGEIEVLLRR